MIVVEIENGEYIFNLEKILKKKKISKNKLVKDTNTDFKVIQRLCKGTIIKLDLYVLARICSYLKCPLTDIVDFKVRKHQNKI